MAYTDPDTVRGILAPGGNGAPGSAASLGDDDIQQAIDEATSEIDGALAVRYGTPFDDPAPDLVCTIARDNAAYLATLTYRQGDPLIAGHPILLRYQRSSALLLRIASGAVSLDVGEDSPPEIDPGAEVVNLNEGTMFEPGDLGLGYRRPRFLHL